jgi:hypothetical protein
LPGLAATLKPMDAYGRQNLIAEKSSSAGFPTLKSQVHEPTKSQLRNQNCDAQFCTDMDTNRVQTGLAGLVDNPGAELLIYLIASTL